HDQEYRADQRDDEAPDRPEGRDAERARRPVTQDRAHDADDDVREQSHLSVGLHDETGEPPDDAADDDGQDEAHGVPSRLLDMDGASGDICTRVAVTTVA